MRISDAQKLVWDNKVAKGFVHDDVPVEFCLMQGEVTEAFDAWRRRQDNLGEELADVVIYVMSLATMTGVDLETEIAGKIEKNASRVYTRDPETGVHTRVDL